MTPFLESHSPSPISRHFFHDTNYSNNKQALRGLSTEPQYIAKVHQPDKKWF